MNNKPKVDVVMTCYNASKFILRAIMSIYKQSYDNWNLIIVDDYSNDNSVKTVEEIIKKLNISNRVKFLLHEKNYGYGKTLKDAIENGDGELIAIVDSDDALSNKDALSIMVKKHLTHPKVSLVYSNYYICDKFLNVVKHGPSRQLKKNESYINTKIRISHLKVFKRSLYNKTSGVNEILVKAVDKDLILKLEEVGEFIFVNKFLYLYRRHQGNLTHTMDKKICSQMRKIIYDDAKRRRGLK